MFSKKSRICWGGLRVEDHIYAIKAQIANGDTILVHEFLSGHGGDPAFVGRLKKAVAGSQVWVAAGTCEEQALPDQDLLLRGRRMWRKLVAKSEEALPKENTSASPLFNDVVIKEIAGAEKLSSSELHDAVRTQLDGAGVIQDPVFSYSHLKRAASEGRGDTVIGSAMSHRAVRFEYDFWRHAGINYVNVSVKPLAMPNLYIALAAERSRNEDILFVDTCGNLIDYVYLSAGAIQYNRRTYAWRGEQSQQHVVSELEQTIKHLSRTRDVDSASMKVLFLAGDMDPSMAGPSAEVWAPMDHGAISFKNDDVSAKCKLHYQQSVVALGIALQGL